MLSVSQIADQFGLSRTAVLYYESVGLPGAPGSAIGWPNLGAANLGAANLGWA